MDLIAFMKLVKLSNENYANIAFKGEHFFA